MDQATSFVQNNGSMIGTVVFIVLALILLYVIYSYIYPAADPTFVQLLQNEADARSPVPISAKPPTIYTGGDFTISMWIYIDDWNYKVASPKFLFSVENPINGKMPIVAILNPYKNNMTVGVNAPGNGTSPSLTNYQTLSDLMANKISMSMFDSGIGSAPIQPSPPFPANGSVPSPGDNTVEVKEIPLQRWTCLTFVSSGSSKLLDIYVDGKLTRSTVFNSILHVPRGPLIFKLGAFGGFGGRYSSVQMWNTQLTPDVIYGIYMMGPTQSQHNILTDISKYLNLNVSFTGSAPGQPIQTVAPSNPFGQISSTASQAYGSAQQDYTSMMQRL